MDTNLNSLARRHKSALTRARNSGDPQRIVTAVDAALADFEKFGYPDNWMLWERAREDARLALVRSF